MKVGDKKGDSVADVLTLLDRRVGKEKELSLFSTEGDRATAVDENGDLVSQDVSIQLGLAKELSAVLDPVVLAEERRAHFEKIKKQVQSGTYQMPSSEVLARSIADELDVDISTSIIAFGE